jgi:SAM-dependent methyltransferase
MDDEDNGGGKHWRKVYEGRAANEMSWHQERPAMSLRLIKRARLPLDDAIIDMGGGASLLVDHLLERGHEDVSVLDISPGALAASRKRLGEARAAKVAWIEADLRSWRPQRSYMLWHDRAVFHFLNGEEERELYRQRLGEALAPGGWLAIATFALDGPEKCSGLPVRRYDAAGLARELGPQYELVEAEREAHMTPAGKIQHFTCCLFRRGAGG